MTLFSSVKKHLPLLIAFLIAGGVGFVYAQSIDIIHACVRNNLGTIRIIDGNETCRFNETPLSWNIQGIPGPTGPSGPPGSSSGRLVCGGCIFQTNFEGGWINKDFSNSLVYSTKFSSNPSTDLTMTGIKFDNSVFSDGVYFWAFDGGNINLANSSFVNVMFKNSGFFAPANNPINLQNSNFSSATFKGGGGFAGVNLRDSNFSQANFDETGFSDTDLTDATGFSTATFGNNIGWGNTICPDGTNSDNNGETCIGHF